MRYLIVIIVLLFSTASAQDLQWKFINDFSGGVRTDLDVTNLPDNAAYILDNAVLNSGAIELRPGYSLWKKRIDALSDGSAPASVYGVRHLYEFYNDVDDEIQFLCAINDEVWWADDDSTNWHRIGLMSGTLTATQNDSIVIGNSTDWWPRMLPDDGSNWQLHIDNDSVVEVLKVVGNKILLEAQWKATTAATAKYELTPVFDSTKNIHFTTVGETCFISDGTRPVVQWSKYKTWNSYYIVDSATIDGFDLVVGTNLMLMTFSDALTLDLVDSAADYGINYYSVVWCDTLKDSTQVYTVPISSYNYDVFGIPFTQQSATKIYTIASGAEEISSTTSSGTKAYICLPLSEAYFFDPDTVYSGIIDFTIDGDVLIDTSVSAPAGVFESVEAMKSGAYYCKVVDTTGNYGASNGYRDFTISTCRAVTVDSNDKTYTGVRVSVDRTVSTHENSLLSDVIGKPYSILKGDYYPKAHFTKYRQGRIDFVATPVYPSNMWYSKEVGYAGLSTTNYYDDVSTADYELIGAGDGDEVTGYEVLQQWGVVYKRHHIYNITNLAAEEPVYLKSSNYGLWSDGFLLPYRENHFGLNRLGMFGYNGADVARHHNLSGLVSSFFTDSLNFAEMDVVRGELYDDYILLSYPNGSSTANDETLVLDTRSGAWTTWDLGAGSFLVRRAPGGLDTLLFGSPDSAAIFVLGGTDDAGTAIDLTYQTPYMDFDLPDWNKQVKKLQVTGRFNHGCSLHVYLYADSLDAENHSVTISCGDKGYGNPVDIIYDFPSDIEKTTRFSLKLVSDDADSLKITRVGLGYVRTERVGAQ